MAKGVGRAGEAGGAGEAGEAGEKICNVLCTSAYPLPMPYAPCPMPDYPLPIT